MSRFLKLLAVCGVLSPSAFVPVHAGGEAVALAVPPPGSQTGIPSAEIQGYVVGSPGPQTVDEVYVRTRYANGSLHPPMNSEGAYDPSAIGWAYPVEWDELTGVGTFEGRAKWLDSGVNHIDVYLPGDVLGAPSYSQTIVYQLASENPADVVAGVHPVQRSVDVVDHEGNPGQLEFRVDLINTTATQTYTVDLVGRVILPDQSVVVLPMSAGSGNGAASFTVAPGDFSYTSVVDPVGMTFSFPLDEAPFPQPTQEGDYIVSVEVYDGPALLYFEENLSFWVSDRSGRAFRDVTKSAGLESVHLQGGHRPSPGNSIGAFDYNRDGLTDLFFTNPSGSETFLPIGDNWPFPGGRNFLMRNEGDATFSDRTAAAGVVGDPDVNSYGVAWGDLNGDGWNDFYVANRTYQPYLFGNDGDGTFTDVAESSFGGPSTRWLLAPRFGDMDADGDLDLYVGCYMSAFSTTWANTGFPNLLYRNELVEGAMDPLFPSYPLFSLVPDPVVSSDGDTLGAFWCDMNQDGALDLFVHHDFGPMAVANQLFRGDGAGGFVDVSVNAGYDVREFSMGSVAADFTGDLWDDLYSTSMGRNSLLVNNGNGTVQQAIEGSNAQCSFILEGPEADGVKLDDNWGAQAWDYDLDGRMDLYVVGSYIFTAYNFPIPELNPDSVFKGNGDGTFERVSEPLGLANAAQGRGVVMIDYDNDGDLDVVTSNENEGVTLMRNDFESGNNAITVRPVTTRSAPGGFNAKLECVSDGLHQRKELMSSSAAASQEDNAWTFGLRTSTAAKLKATWTRGGSTVYYGVPAGGTLALWETVVEVDGAIDAEVQVGHAPTVRLLGEPGEVYAAAVGDLTLSGPLPLPGGAILDIVPIAETMVAGVLDSTGTAPWPLPAMNPAWVGITFELQAGIVDAQSSVVSATSGVSTITVVD